ncbi:UNVERIFIED_CONTAM: Aspartyl protease family protein 2 [Sesamum angustifolium]|uniref:Aspartyl protease family protein 2 n=1 Tax=Sesamum angustifolium TaxID=2727405 RepID=A0AAW2IM41_9LAMI
MDATPISLSISFPFLLSLFLTISSSSSAATFQYQTLVLTSLPKPQTLSWPTLQDSETQFQAESQTTLSLDLHHLDNLSPDFKSTPQSLFKLRLRRDAIRVKALSTIAAVSQTNVSGQPPAAGDFSSSVISGLAQGSGEYFTRIGIGTPPKSFLWIPTLPPSGFARMQQPTEMPLPGLLRDGSFTVGEFSTETLTFRRTKVSNVALGCGHDNEGLFVGAAGLLGLGRGKLSFPTQAGSRFGGKFSYCLVDRSASSKPSSMVFGESAVSRNAVFTPLLTNPKLDTFYYVGLNGISVGGARVPGITPSLFKMDQMGSGGVIVDSGTSVTRLTRPAYVALRDAFRAGATNLKRAPDFSLFDTCFDLSGKTEVKVPTVVLHFEGADVSLPASNYLIPVDSEGKFCFAFAGTMSGLSIIGNIQQQGFRVVFDMANNRVGFAARGCA